ncbi:MAG: Tad domain-containing protein [Chloroflexota bacterium]|nr:Tad domain-containing protein [Chloroflexota bacterium]
MSQAGRRSEEIARGQILVIVGLSMVGLIAMLGLVIDVGFAWAANRDAQNGIDAASQAGAIVMVQNMAGPTSRTDEEVAQAVAAAASANGITLDRAEYADWRGDPLNPSVGVGSLPPGSAIPSGAQGVHGTGSLVHLTLLAQVIGIDRLTANAQATVVGGPASEPCPSTGVCALLPLTFPTTIVTCDGQNRAIPTTDQWVKNTEYIIPLCGNNPGSVGWIDWNPPNGGTSELATEICDPHPPTLDLPDWFEVTSTGNVNSPNVENCLNKYAGQRIFMPVFDDTCRENPGEGNPCTNPAATGQNQWYHFPSYAVFELRSPKGAYINGNNKAVCEQGNNGATSCLIGRFVDSVSGGSVGQWDPNAPPRVSTQYAIQLVH